MVKTIPLSQGQVAIVDDADFDRVSTTGGWCFTTHPGDKTGYATRSVKLGGRWTTQLLHRFVLHLKPGDLEVDCINGNGLDCRRENLRLATHQQNLCNQGKRRGSFSSQFKGVTWDKAKGKWQAQITANYKYKGLGYFNTELSAATAYDSAAVRLHGKFARLNFARASGGN